MAWKHSFIRSCFGKARSTGVLTRIGNHPDSHVGDVGFHLVGDQFDAPTNWLNVVPGNGTRVDLPDGTILKNLNLSRYKTDFENRVRDLADIPGNNVEVSIQTIYTSRNSSLRPDIIRTAYRVNGGRWQRARFQNRAG